MTLNGNISAQGNSANATYGGGSGGTLLVNALSLIGSGDMIANGGAGGGDLSTPGGGGGGGYILIFNELQDYTSYSFSGTITTTGGAAGVVYESAVQSFDVTLSNAAQPGQSGLISLPKCPPGYGNNLNQQNNDSVCAICPVGTYSYGTNEPSGCTQCTNAPQHSYYYLEGETSPDCNYDCDPGYSTSNCLTPFENIIFNVLGIGGVAGIMIAFICLIILPPLYLRLSKRYGWHKAEDNDGFGDLFFKPDLAVHEENLMHMKKQNRKEEVLNPLSVDTRKTERGEQTSSISSFNKSDLPINRSTPMFRNYREERKAFRLADADLPSHACRIYLLGANHPFERYGKSSLFP